MTVFVILAGGMLAIALAFAILPLMRRHRGPETAGDGRRLKALDDALAAGVIDRDEYAAKRSSIGDVSAAAGGTAATGKGTRLATIAIAILLPASAVVLYRIAGEPAALDPLRAAVAAAPADGEHGVDMGAAIASLVAKLDENPDNADGWALLGRAYQASGQFAESRDALKRAYDLSSDSHDMAVEYAQALALSGEGRRIIGEPRTLIENVLKADPDHQRALWLIGISDYQQGNYDAAIAAWNRLLPNLPPDSDIAQSVRAQIADAQKLGGSAVPTAPTAAVSAATPNPAPVATPPPAADTSGTGPRLTVRVSLDPKLAGRLDPSATLFVFARAASGPPMPLAIQRVSASQLPLTVTLDDSMGMMPTMKLSMFPQVVVGARISGSGDARAQSGDLQVISAPIDVTRNAPLDLVIDSIVP